MDYTAYGYAVLHLDQPQANHPACLSFTPALTYLDLP